MLYIDNISEGSIRFGNEPAGADVKKVYPDSFTARGDEEGLIWIWHDHNNECIINGRAVAEITLDGTVYGTAEEFVTAFNTAVA